MMSFSAAKKRLGKSLQQYQSSIPILHTLPGIYSVEESSRKRRIRPVPEEQVTRKLLQIQGLSAEDSPTHPIVKEVIPNTSRFMAATAMPWLDVGRCSVQYGVSCKGCQVAIEKNVSIDFEARDWVFSKDGFLEHYQSCTEARELWKASCGGTIPFDEPELTKRGGCMNDRNDDNP